MQQESDADTADYRPPMTEADSERPMPWSARVAVEIGAQSHRGKVRPNNEDHYLTLRFGRSMAPLQTNLPQGQIPASFTEEGYGLVVADGVGGAAAGEVASRLAISLGVDLALSSPKWTLVRTPEEIRENLETWRERFRLIDALLTERGRADPNLAGMATTLTAASSVGDHLCLYHIGDSRAYLFRRGRLHRLTQDHTLAQSLVALGCLSPEQVASHHLRHILTRCLGRGGGEVEAELQHVRLADGDWLLLCTDGLTEMVPDARIAEILSQAEGAEEASSALVEQALEAGGKDNVTVVLARYTIPTAAADNPG